MNQRAIAILEDNLSHFEQLARSLRRLGWNPILISNPDVTLIAKQYDAFIIDIDWNRKDGIHDRSLEQAGINAVHDIHKVRGSDVFIAIWSNFVDENAQSLVSAPVDVIVEKSKLWESQAGTIHDAYISHKLDLLERAIRSVRADLKDYVDRLATFVFVASIFLLGICILPGYLVDRFFQSGGLLASSIGVLIWMVMLRWLGEKRIKVTDWKVFSLFCEIEKHLLGAAIVAILIEIILAVR